MSTTADVVVTGLGATTPLGADVDSTWQALLAGRSGVSRITDDWVQEFPAQLVARLATEPSEQIDRRKLLQCLTAALARCMGDETPGPASVQPLFDGWNTKREMKHG